MKYLANSISIILAIAGALAALNGQIEGASFSLLLAIYIDGRLFLYKD
jgi:hypothetical protein